MWFPDVASSPAIQALAALIDYDWETYTETLAGLSWGWSAGDEARKFAALLRDSITREDAKRQSAATADVSSLLARIVAPTLIVHHSDAIVTTIETGRRLAEQIPDARLVALEGRAAFSGLTDPRMMAAIDEFLAEDGDRLKHAGALPSGTAIILFADVVDSTALTERMGDAAFRERYRQLDASVREIINESGGTAVAGRTLGDGVLAAFTSAREAIAGALRCATAGDECALPLHLGIHAGDVIREENNVWGGAVNIASRVSALSAAGEVLVSGTVRDLARTSSGVAFDDRGEHVLKGIAGAVRVFAVRRALAESP